MSLHPQPIPAIPEETIRVAHAVLPKGNVWMQMRDELAPLYEDQDFADLFPSRGQPAEARQIPLQEGIGLLQARDIGYPQFDDQPLRHRCRRVVPPSLWPAENAPQWK